MPASDGYSSHQDAIRYLSRHDQIKAAATAGRPSRRFSRAILLLLGVSRNGKMQQRQRPATTVVASPRQWRIFVAYPSDSLRGLRYAFPEEVPAMKRFALIIPCPIGLSPFLAFCLQLWVMRSVRSRLSGCAYRPLVRACQVQFICNRDGFARPG